MKRFTAYLSNKFNKFNNLKFYFRLEYQSANQRSELVSPENLQEECKTKKQCCFICQKDRKRDLQLPTSKKGIFFGV